MSDETFLKARYPLDLIDNITFTAHNLPKKDKPDQNEAILIEENEQKTPSKSKRKITLQDIFTLYRQLHLTVTEWHTAENPAMHSDYLLQKETDEKKVENSKRLVEPYQGTPVSTAEITNHAEQAVTQAVEKLLPQLLEKTEFSEAERAAIIQAAAVRDFSGVSIADPDAFKAALLAALVAERSRTDITVDGLAHLSDVDLKNLGMRKNVRDSLVHVLSQLTASNSEYVREMIRGIEKANRTEQPVDAVREWRRLYRAIGTMIETLSKESSEDQPSFIEENGTAGVEFIQYLEAIKDSFAVFDLETNEPYSKEKRDALIEAARVQFVDFYKKNPSFPLIILPASDTYINQGFAETFGQTPDLGMDPEMRVLWQSPAERGKATILEEARAPFADNLLQKFPQLSETDVAGIRKAVVIIAQDLFAGGINMKYHAPAQRLGEANVFMENTQKAEYNIPATENIKKLVPSELHALLDSENFSNALNTIVILHELVHEIFPTESEFTAGISEINELLKETKSDTLARTVFSEVFTEKAKADFAENATVMLNLVMIADDLQTLKNSKKTDESSAYWTGAVTRLHFLLEKEIIVQDGDSFRIELANLTEDIGKNFLEYGNKILDTYALAKTDKQAGLEQAQALSAVTASPKLEALQQFLS